jgi:D-sedoheptulose 7-phosphate isomerase
MEVSGANGAPLDPEAGGASFVEMLTSVGKAGASVYLVGNGGSAAVCAHIANDLVNMCKLRALTLHEPSTLTCMANDYGYEAAYARVVDTLCRRVIFWSRSAVPAARRISTTPSRAREAAAGKP